MMWLLQESLGFISYLLSLPSPPPSIPFLAYYPSLELLLNLMKNPMQYAMTWHLEAIFRFFPYLTPSPPYPLQKWTWTQNLEQNLLLCFSNLFSLFLYLSLQRLLSALNLTSISYLAWIAHPRQTGILQKKQNLQRMRLFALFPFQAALPFISFCLTHHQLLSIYLINLIFFNLPSLPCSKIQTC